LGCLDEAVAPIAAQYQIEMEIVAMVQAARANHMHDPRRAAAGFERRAEKSERGRHLIAIAIAGAASL
jgi:hypothetical protein